mmetsp:Transcript_8928/g.32186  ORF Transcript_8928/g.32186 Transcript_8928/m.32186 type:complete len:261 (+) Transcript_8928:1628-2410(+)
MRFCNLAEGGAQQRGDLPGLGENIPEGLLPRQQLLHPSVPPVGLLELRGRRLIRREDLLVGAHLLVADSADELVLDVGVDGLHDPARVRELVQRFGRNILLGGGVDEIVEYCGPEAGLDRAELAPQLAYLWNLVEGLKMGSELVHRLEQVGGLPVVPLVGHLLQVLNRGHQHRQPPEGCDGVGEVSLRVVELLDVPTYLLNLGLALLSLRLNLGDPSGQVLDPVLGLAEVLLRAASRLALLSDRNEDLVIHLSYAPPELH